MRFIGVTGHGWTIAAMHKRSLERFDFDSVLLPYNYVMHQNERYREDFDTVRPALSGTAGGRPDHQSHCAGPMGHDRQNAQRPGISPWKNRRTSTGLCTG